jgi:hypothetical protein
METGEEALDREQEGNEALERALIEVEEEGKIQIHGTSDTHQECRTDF